jgi:hypothetical protein
MRELIERLELLSEATFSRDKEARDKARAFHKALVSYVEKNKDNLKKISGGNTGMGGFVIEAKRFWSGEGADNLFVMYVPAGAKGKGVSGGLGVHGPSGKDVLVLPVLKGPWDTTGIDTRTDKSLIVHEMIHFFDPGRGKGKDVDPQRAAAYYNHPSEWNAYWQEGASSVEGMANNKMLHTPDRWEKVFGDGSFKEFRSKMMRMKAWNQDYLKNMNAKNKKKFETRLYQLWQGIMDNRPF